MQAGASAGGGPASASGQDWATRRIRLPRFRLLGHPPGYSLDIGLRTAFSDEIATRDDGLDEGLSTEVVCPGLGGYV